LREHPADDPDVRLLSARSRETFAQAASLLDSPAVPVSIPYEGTTLPGYIFAVDDSGVARPTVIYNNGYDSTLEEAYFAVGAAALSRGYNVLAFDGPGQGATLREQSLVFRPDWEKVISPVIDFALTRPEIDPEAIALFGYSLGRLLVVRAAAYEHRVAALILDDGLYDLYAAFTAASPSFFVRWVDQGRQGRVNSAVAQAALPTRSLTGSWPLALEPTADRKYRVAATDARQIPSAITRTVPSLGHGHRWVSCSRRVVLCVTTFSDRYATTAVARTAAVSAAAWTTCHAGRWTGRWGMGPAVLRRRRRYLLTTRLTAASANVMTPVVSVRNHGSTGQYGLASDAPPKMATRHVLAQHSAEA
jgi:pimeloyl-ACP methyl ester carboxylesterase